MSSPGSWWSPLLSGFPTQCQIGKSISEVVYLNSGIDEGSMLGPMCFITTLVNLSVFAEKTVARVQVEGMEIKVYIVAYADDVSALLIGDIEEVLQKGIDII